MTGHDMADEVMSWLDELQKGVMTSVMTRGKHLYFQCDGRNHYVYEVDETRREIKRNGKPGRKKRSYLGTFDACRASYPAESARWIGRHKHGHDNPKHGHDTGGDRGFVGTLAGHPIYVAEE